MRTHSSVLNSAWFGWLHPEQQQLIKTGLTLLSRAEELPAPASLSDYSYIIFPLAKAYEGFVKDFLLELNLVNERIYKSRRFRIGRSINPDVREKYRDRDWVYDDIVRLCSPELADQLWTTWLECRNRVFHYFPGKNKFLNLAQVRTKTDLVLQTMETASQYLPN